jgi:hypothetical protein
VVLLVERVELETLPLEKFGTTGTAIAGIGASINNINRNLFTVLIEIQL